MKYNTTYTQKNSLRKTIELTNKIRNEFLQFLQSKAKMTYVLAPAFYLEEDHRNAINPLQTRAISFDTASEYRVGKVSMSDSAYLRQLIVKTKPEIDHGYYTEHAFIFRDGEESPTSSITSHEITAQIVVKDASKNATQKLMRDWYERFYKLASEIEKNQHIKNAFPAKIAVIDAQNLEDEFNDKNPREREKLLALDLGAFAIANPQQRLRSGKVHQQQVPEIYALDNFLQVIVKDQINFEALPVVVIAEIALGEKLLQQTKEMAIRQTSEYANLFKEKMQIIEIKINLPKTVMTLLSKGHIAEVQPDVFSDESKVVKLKYKVEVF